MLENSNGAGHSVVPDPQLEALVRKALADRVSEPQAQIARFRNELRSMVGDAVGPEDDPKQLARVCSEAYLRFKEMMGTPLNGDPSGMREHVETLVGIDPKVALGAVFEMTREEHERERAGVSASHRAAVMERTNDLVVLLNNMCQGPAGTVGLARLRALLRYILERNYHQNTTAIETLSCGSLKLMDIANRRFVTWSPDLKSGDLGFDLGCASGGALDTLEKMVGTGNARGIDFNPLAAMRDERIRVGIIDASQKTLGRKLGGAIERLSFEKDYFGKGGLVFASLVVDRVANQGGLFMNCSKLLRPGGTLVIALLLPVKCEDDEPDLDHRLQYAVEPLTAGENKFEDYELISSHLGDIGFGNVLIKRLPIDDPVSGRLYQNHYLLIARKKEEGNLLQVEGNR